MINYTEKGTYLFDEIARQGHRLRKKSGVWVADDEVAVQAIIDSFDPLPDAKRDKINELKREAARQAASIYPHLAPPADLEVEPGDIRSWFNMLEDLTKMIKPAARDPLPQRLSDLKAVRDKAESAVTAINALTALELVQAYDVTTDPGW